MGCAWAAFFRCAPEHLRAATPVENHLDQAINGRPSRAISRNLRNPTSTRFRDLFSHPLPNDSDDSHVEELGVEPDSKRQRVSVTRNPPIYDEEVEVTQTQRRQPYQAHAGDVRTAPPFTGDHNNLFQSKHIVFKPTFDFHFKASTVAAASAAPFPCRRCRRFPSTQSETQTGRAAAVKVESGDPPLEHRPFLVCQVILAVLCFHPPRRQSRGV